jgi:dimeric dUTPase (all-alpha-NTP-PPase superfamily)
MVMNSNTGQHSQSETVIFEEGASHFHNFIAVGGTLQLTNKRLIFKSCSTNHYQHEIFINLEQVSGVEFFKTLFMNPNGLALLLSNGQMENFIVDDKKAWKSRIQSVIGLPA